MRAGEDPVIAALRESYEECGLDFDSIEWVGKHVSRDRRSVFTTVIVNAVGEISTTTTWEAVEHRWVLVNDVDQMSDLHPGFRASWGAIRQQLSKIGATS